MASVEPSPEGTDAMKNPVTRVRQWFRPQGAEPDRTVTTALDELRRYREDEQRLKRRLQSVEHIYFPPPQSQEPRR